MVGLGLVRFGVCCSIDQVFFMVLSDSWSSFRVMLLGVSWVYGLGWGWCVRCLLFNMFAGGQSS